MSAALDIKDFTHGKLAQLINNIDSFKSAIKPEVLADILTESNLNIEDLANLVNFDPNVYCRTYAAKMSHADLLVIGWRSGQLTPIHDHTGSSCAIKVIKGSATEIIYSESQCGSYIPISSEKYPEGNVFYSYDKDVHQMGNIEGKDSDLVTLHCYSPPLTGMKLFDESTAFFKDYAKTYSLVSNRLANQ